MRVGVVGAGYLGRIHARIYAQLPDVELVGIVDTDRERAAALTREFGGVPHDRAEALLGSVDAVSIVVPTTAHLSVARPFLEAGVHTLLEKPIATTLDEAGTLVQLADQAGVVFQIGHQERYNAGVRALTARLDDPRFIEVHRLGGFVERATDVDVVTDLMIHDIDIVLAMVRSPIRVIFATGVPVLTDHADIANARLEFENGAVANVTASRVSVKKQRRIRVFGRHHYLALDYIDQQLEEVRALPAADGGRQVIHHEKIAVTPVLPLDAELADFVECVRNHSTPRVSGRDGLAALRVAMQVQTAIRNSYGAAPR